MPFNDLPTEILDQIGSYLDTTSLGRLACTSKCCKYSAREGLKNRTIFLDDGHEPRLLTILSPGLSMAPWIQYLNLNLTIQPENFCIRRSMGLIHWNLRGLYMEIKFNGWDQDASLFCGSLLRTCAHSIETLVWHAQTKQYPFEQHQFHTFDIPAPRLMKLESLELRGLKCDEIDDDATIDESNDLSVGDHESEVNECEHPILGPLLPQTLVNLVLFGYQDEVALEPYLRTCGTLSCLQNFQIDLSHGSNDIITMNALLGFLWDNPQLSKISLSSGNQDTEKHILPMLSSNFSNLTSLRLNWSVEEPEIPQSALKAICEITSLEQLHLSYGNPYDWDYHFLVDHDVMRRYLPGLQKLKYLAFSRDTFKNRFSSSGEEYYSHRTASDAELKKAGMSKNPRNREILWENLHKLSMTKEATKYFSVAPQLKQILIGQYMFEPVRNANMLTEARALHEERDHTEDLEVELERMFMWPGRTDCVDYTC